MAMSGYWGPNITGQLLESQRWAGPDKLIGGIFDTIAGFKIDAARRKARKAGAAMDEFVGPLTPEQEKRRSILDEIAYPGRSIGPATEAYAATSGRMQMGLELEREKEEHQIRLAEARRRGAMTEAEMIHRQRIEEIKQAGRMPVEKLRAETDIEEAKIRAEATKYGADQRLAGTGLTAEARETAARLNAAERRYATDRTAESRAALQAAMLEHQKALTERRELGATERTLITQEGALNRETMRGTSALGLESLRQTGRERLGEQRHGYTMSEIGARGDELENLARLKDELENEGIREALSGGDVAPPLVPGLGPAPSASLQFQPEAAGTAEAQVSQDFGKLTDRERVQRGLMSLMRAGKVDEAAKLGGILNELDRVEKRKTEETDKLLEADAIRRYWNLREKGLAHNRAFPLTLKDFPTLSAEASNRLRLHAGAETKASMDRLSTIQRVAENVIGPPTDIEKTLPEEATKYRRRLKAEITRLAKAQNDQDVLKLIDKVISDKAGIPSADEESEAPSLFPEFTPTPTNAPPQTAETNTLPSYKRFKVEIVKPGK